MAYTDLDRNKFLEILTEIKNLLGYSLRSDEPQPGEELAMEMMYGGFDFSVVHSNNFRPEALLIECRFGPVPEGRELPIMEKLLQMNCALAELDGSTFCIEAESGDLIYTLAKSMNGLDGKTLLYKMTEIVWHGRRWMETRFIQEAGNKSNNSFNSVALA
jgi:hypothetical protein